MREHEEYAEFYERGGSLADVRSRNDFPSALRKKPWHLRCFSSEDRLGNLQAIVKPVNRESEYENRPSARIAETDDPRRTIPDYL